MDFQKAVTLSPMAFGVAFFGVYTADWLFGVPIPNVVADGLLLGIAGVALLVGLYNARTGGRFVVTLAHPLAVAMAVVSAEVVREILADSYRTRGPTLETYAILILLAVLLGSIVYGVGTLLKRQSVVDR